MPEQEASFEDVVQGEYVVPDDFDDDTAEVTEEIEETEETEEETQDEESGETEEAPDKEVETKGPYAGWTREQIEIQLQREQKEKNRAQAELRKTLKEQQASKEQGALTKDQLIGILREHKDDPEATFQVFDYMAAEHAKKAESNTVDAVKLAQTKSVTDRYVQEKFPELLDENNPNYHQIQELKNQLGIANNPHSDYIIGNLVLGLNSGKIMNDTYTKGLNEGQGKSVEQKRKKSIKEGKLENSTTTKKSSKIATPEMENTIRILGLTGKAKEDYIKMMSKGGA